MPSDLGDIVAKSFLLTPNAGSDSSDSSHQGYCSSSPWHNSLRKFNRLLEPLVEKLANSSLPMCTDGGLALVSYRGVVAVQMVADFSGCRQQLILLLMKSIVPIKQDVRNLSRRDINAEIAELFQDAILSYVILMCLEQNVLPQAESEV
jgi:hypothetical protein